MNWEALFEEKIKQSTSANDPAHDLLHIKRVVSLAKTFCLELGAKAEVVIPAAWLHDLVVIPKDSGLRSKASKICAEQALEYLKSINYPSEFYSEISHAIESHSFSANVEAKTLEAKIVQDADRIDGLGAVGVARCFATAGLLNRQFYDESDPMCVSRTPDDSKYTVDHFYKKLFKTAQSLKTESGIKEGIRRLKFMKDFLGEFSKDCQSNTDKRWQPPTLTTQRLILRDLRLSDSSSIFRYAKNPNVCRYTLWEAHQSEEISREYLINYVFPYYSQKVPEPFAITLKDSPDKVIGTVGCFWISKAARSMELAYAISEEYWGQGIVPEAARAVMDFCFKAYQLNRIQARCKVENIASARVMEKIGMKFEGTLKASVFHREKLWDMHYYAILKE